MGRVEIAGSTVKYKVGEATYYVKEHFEPTFRYSMEERSHQTRKTLISESFFSYGPIEKIVSLLGQKRANVVQIKLQDELPLTAKEKDLIANALGPQFYFSRSCYDYNSQTLVHTDPEIAMGFQVILDIVVRNWDDGERNICVVDGIPVFFDFGASLDPSCQNIYRFLLKLDETAKAARVSSIISYFSRYSRRRSNIIKRAIRVFQAIPLWEIRAITNMSEPKIPGYFGEYLAGNIYRLNEEVDILRGAFLRRPPREGFLEKRLEEPTPIREGYLRQTK